ncbi:uncharacterized protein LOC109827762 [Asparagus officinalis]|uniref:uncharacterized protein LOC109827762 n=1 Tax=Asparagus officinalis TaxID=4686 RepID=UPI00098DF0F5|nr:uncharacterized protein LOC109827762 [Asparagus officinalis]
MMGKRMPKKLLQEMFEVCGGQMWETMSKVQATEQEALENTYSEVVAQSQEPLTREQNYNVSHLVCGLPKKGRTRWMGVGAQRVSTQFQSLPISTPSTMSSGPSYMPQEDCTQQAM